MQAPYSVLEDWQKYYGGNLLIVLPDTYGTALVPAQRAALDRRMDGFSPRQRAANRRRRADHRMVAEPRTGSGGEAADLFRRARCRATIEKEPSCTSRDRVRMAFGWGTNLTNDFSDSAPARNEALKAISLVCKVSSAKRASGGETVRQCREGDRRSRRHRPLHPPVRRREPGEETGLRLIRSSHFGEKSKSQMRLALGREAGYRRHFACGQLEIRRCRRSRSGAPAWWCAGSATTPSCCTCQRSTIWPGVLR